MQIITLPPVSNRATWTETYQPTDRDTGEGISLDSVSVILEVEDPDTEGVVLSASIGSGVTVLEDDDDEDYLEWQFTYSQMSTLCAKTYKLRLILEDDGERVQAIIGRLPVLDG